MNESFSGSLRGDDGKIWKVVDVETVRSTCFRFNMVGIELPKQQDDAVMGAAAGMPLREMAF